jgi:hypothetical protein
VFVVHVYSHGLKVAMRGSAILPHEGGVRLPIAVSLNILLLVVTILDCTRAKYYSTYQIEPDNPELLEETASRNACHLERGTASTVPGS